MANSEKLPDEALAVVAAQVGERIAGVAGDLLRQLSQTPALNSNVTDNTGESEPTAQPNIKMGASFAVWMLGADSVLLGARKGADLLDLAKATGHAHHQIKFDGQALAYARSLPLGDKPIDRSLCELSVSALAEEIQKAMHWSDENVSDDYLTRLLIVPAYHVRAFWFVKEDEEQALERTANAETAPESFVYILSAPARFRTLKPAQRLGSKDFLKALLDETVITGYR